MFLWRISVIKVAVYLSAARSQLDLLDIPKTFLLPAKRLHQLCSTSVYIYFTSEDVCQMRDDTSSRTSDESHSLSCSTSNTVLSCGCWTTLCHSCATSMQMFNLYWNNIKKKVYKPKYEINCFWKNRLNCKNSFRVKRQVKKPCWMAAEMRAVLSGLRANHIESQMLLIGKDLNARKKTRKGVYSVSHRETRQLLRPLFDDNKTHEVSGKGERPLIRQDRHREDLKSN